MKREKFSESRLQAIIDRHERLRKSYFWSSPSTASARRQMERRESTTYCFKRNHKIYEIDQDVSCSCKHVYYRLLIYVDGKRKDVRVLKSLLRG